MTDNITMRTEGDKLVIEIDLSREYGPSSSGKTTVVASTKGNKALEEHDGFFIGLNVYRKP